MVRPACVGVSRPPKAVEEKWFICWLVLRGPSKPVYVSVHSNTVNAVDSRAECAFTVSSPLKGYDVPDRSLDWRQDRFIRKLSPLPTFATS